MKIIIIPDKQDSDPLAGAIIFNIPLTLYIVNSLGLSGAPAWVFGIVILWLLVQISCGFFNKLQNGGMILITYFGMMFVNLYIVGAWFLGAL